jgi:transposase
MKTITKNFVGVDISKNWLDVHIHPKNLSVRVDNTQIGISSLLKTFSDSNIDQIVCESSGGYENLLMSLCSDAGHKIWRVDPKRIKAFIASEGVKAKTDRIDARMIALFASQKKSTYEQSKRSDYDEKIRSFVRRKADLIEIAAMEKKRLKGPTGLYCRDRIEKFLAVINKDIEELENEIQNLIKQDEELNKKNEILQSIPGIGKTTAAALIADMPELGAIENKKAAALLGVAPYTKQSGMYKGNEVISGGRPAPRKALYMAALSAMRHNKTMKTFYTRLRDNGKKPKVAIVAVMNKFIVTINAMLRKKEKWVSS